MAQERPSSALSSETLAESPNINNARKSQAPSVESDDGWGEVSKPGENAPNAIPGTEDALHFANRKKYSVFTVWQKRGTILLAAAGAFLGPLTGQIYFPSLPTIAKEYGVSIASINLTVTVYIIFQGITPMFVAPFSDQTGRRPAYIASLLVFLAGNIGCALAPNYSTLMVTRIIQSAGASTGVALCQSIVSDMVTSAERGQYVGWTALPIILAPCIGPVIGGLFAQFVGWRWNFWFLTIMAGVVAIAIGMLMPETCRNIVDDGSVVPRNFYRPWWPVMKETLAARKAAKTDNIEMNGMEKASKAEKTPIKIKGVNPLRAFLLMLEPEMFILLMYSGLIFACFSAVSTAMPPMLGMLYGFDEMMVGAMYTPMGVGSMVAAFVVGNLQNKNFERHAAKHGLEVDKESQQDLKDFPIERVRLEIGIPMVLLTAACILGWGWVFQYRAPVYVPCILLFFMGVALVGFTNSINILLVDINPGIAGAAAAVSNFTRSAFGAAASAAISPMLQSLGPGWAFTTLGLICVGFAPALLLVIRNGLVWREKKMVRRQARMQKIMEKQREKAMAEAKAMIETMQAAQAAEPPAAPGVASVPTRAPTIDEGYQARIAALRIPNPRLSVWGETGLRGSLWVADDDIPDVPDFNLAANTARNRNGRNNRNRYSMWDTGEDWVPDLNRQSTWGHARNRESVMWGNHSSAMFG